MLKKISVFTLALVSGAATAGPLADTVNGLLGAGGPAPSSLIAPIAAPLTSAVSTLEASAAPVTSAAPLPGLTPGKASGDLLAVGVLDGDNTGNGGMVSAAVLSGTNSGQSPDGLSVGVLNQGDPLHVSGMGMSLPTILPSAVTDPLIAVGGTAYDDLRELTVLGKALAPVGSGLENVTDIVSPGITLLGADANPNSSPDANVNAGVISGDNSGSGGDIGVSVLSTSSSQNPGSTAKAGVVGVGVLNGNAAGPINTTVIVTPGANPDDNKETAQKDDQSELCKLLEKDNRGRVQGKLALKARCHIKTGA